ncbi:MAG: helix-turn-helix domain-containing protein [Streptosporangiales bacterium]|nr:helix-turn-helix domain-containing protein [Streptosporangiales bacterium]
MQPVVRALAVLRSLAPTPNGLTLAQLAGSLDVPVGSMHRLLAVLEREEFVTRSPSNRRYFLGPGARQLAEESSRMNALLVTPHPALTGAADASGETVFLTELVGDRAVCVSLVESVHALRMFVRIGQDLPLHAAAAARTLLAYATEDHVRRLLGSRPLHAYTDDTLTDVDAVVGHLAVVRERGYDVCDDELDRGVWAVSMPVRTSTGRVAASVTLAAPAYRVADVAERDRMRGLVRDAADAMSADLGHLSGRQEKRATTSAVRPRSSSS